MGCVVLGDFIKEHWENQGNKHHKSYEASWGDIFAINLEIETIGMHLDDNQTVLDAGCANGFSTFKQWETKNLKQLYGIDFSSNMIDNANKEKVVRGINNEILFSCQDIRKLNFENEFFDVVYTTRVIINLPNWEEQKKAIDEIIRVTKPKGKIILSEAFWEPLILLNSLRNLVRLPLLVEHDFNRYLKKSYLEEYINQKGFHFDVDEFSSVYYLGSRFLRELVTSINDYKGYTNPINEKFYELEKTFSGGGFGIQQAYIITKL